VRRGSIGRQGDVLVEIPSQGRQKPSGRFIREESVTVIDATDITPNSRKFGHI
jgi:hypothetical protein